MKRILLLEDDLAVSYASAYALETAGYIVDTVTTASDAILSFKSEDYDLVITDMLIRYKGRTIPDGGINLINWLRSGKYLENESRSVPILGISGAIRNRGLEHLLEIAKSLGADDSLEKPFGDEALLQKVYALIGRADDDEDKKPAKSSASSRS